MFYIIVLMSKIRIFFWVLIIAITFLAVALGIATAATNIDSVYHWAWNDALGWIDFYGTDSVNVRGDRLEGYATSNLGDVSLDCATTRNGNICGASNYGVCNGPGPHDSSGSCPSGDGSGNLTGWAWNDEVGWVSFGCDQTSHGGSNTCALSNYQVSIDGNGDFVGYGWSEVAGWISFNCANTGSCGVSNYKTKTNWQAVSAYGYLESSILDTGIAGGVTLIGIIWQGDQPSGTSVDFQIAVSNDPGGPWNYFGPGGDSNSFYGAECPVAGAANPGAGPNKSICVDKSLATNYRYLRYLMRLKSNTIQTLTPKVDDVIMNWSE